MCKCDKMVIMGISFTGMLFSVFATIFAMIFEWPTWAIIDICAVVVLFLSMTAYGVASMRMNYESEADILLSA